MNKLRCLKKKSVFAIVLPMILWSLTGSALAQSKLIKGVVTDAETKETLPGVSVKVKRTNKAVFTDVNGRYAIQALSSDVLVFSYVGFLAKEVQIGTKSEVNTALNPNVNALKEVVVIGYGEVAKSDLTGSVGQVNVADIVQAPVMSVEEALAGRVAGVQVAASDGQPGSEGVNITIRGAGSLTQSTSPLVVVDGFPFEDFDLSSLNMNDIEEMNVLKDASATAIYGSRGANGVIVIETKKGKAGTPEIQYSGSFGLQNVTKQMEMMNSFEFVKYQLERNNYSAAIKNIYTKKDLNPEDDDNYDANGKTLEDYKNIPGINWQDLVFQNGATRIHNLSVRGGDTKTKYSISGSLYNQEGVVIYSGSDRATARVTLNHTLSKKFKGGVNLSYSHKKSFGQVAADNAGSSGHAYTYLMYSAWAFRPVTGKEELYYDEDLDGEIADTDEDFIDAEIDESLTSTLFAINPVKSLKNEDRQSKSANLNANADLTYDISKSLQFKTTAGYIKVSNDGYNFYNSGTTRGSSTLPSNSRGVQSTLSLSETVTWNSSSYLTFKKKIADHSLNAMAGIDFQERTIKRYGMGSQLIPNESLGLWGMDEGVPSSMTVATSTNTLNSVFTRLNYNFKSKYLLTGTFRADGSSRFPVNNRWGYFPSGAFAWKMASENFMKNLKFISDAKLRISYGLTGNNRVSDYPDALMAGAIAQSYSFANGDPTKGLYPSTLGNYRLKWETTEQIDLGYDLSLFKNRIEITADLYRKTTEDLLLNANIPTIFGFNKNYKNVGSLQNDGLELTLNTQNIKTRNFSWNSSLNIGFNKNKILSLTSDESRMLSTVTWDALHNGSSLYTAQVGQQAALFVGYIFDGIYQLSDFDLVGAKYVLKPNIPDNGEADREDVQPGDIKYKDLNGDGTVNGFDETIIGNPMPKHLGGLTNNFRYKGFNLNVFLQWSFGNEVFNANRIYFEGGRPQNSRNQFATYVNRWTPENPSNTMFRAGGQGPLGRYSSLYLEDASYLRLKTVSLSYSIPAKYVNKVHIKNLSLTASAQNLFTITNYSGMDPEVSVRHSILTPGFDWSAYPRAKIMVFGVKVTL